MIPKFIVDVVEAARAFVRARRALAEHLKAGTTGSTLAKAKKNLRETSRALDRVVVELERRLSAEAKTGPKAASEPFPWQSMFKAVGEFAGLVAKAKVGDPSVLRDVAGWADRHGPGGRPADRPGPRAKVDDIIDAEIVE